MTSTTRILAAALCIAAWLLLVAVTIWRRRTGPLEAVAPDAVLIGYASQTGTAAALAQATADALTASGCSVAVRSLSQITPEDLARATDALFIAATAGEGDPPDDAAQFLVHWGKDPRPLPKLRYALLALGDRAYEDFCGFGHALDDLLQGAGATAAADLIEVDQGDDDALRQWQQTLRLFGASAALPDWKPPRYALWQLGDREALNPGSPGAPMYRIRLTPLAALPVWAAGDIAEVYPGPGEEGTLPRPALSHRDYSIATIPDDGGIELIVRLFRDAEGRSGLGSGWLCEQAAVGTSIALRIRENARFHAPRADVPMILIGNGTGISGLRAHLRARPEGSRNWLIFGERDAACDRPLGAELEAWEASGHLRLDRVFSRGEGSVRYVQHAVVEQAALLRSWLDVGAAIYLCGSVAMGHGVDAALKEVLGEDGVAALLTEKRYCRDIY